MKIVIHEHAAAVAAAAAAMLEFADANPGTNIGIVIDTDCMEVLRAAFESMNRHHFDGCRFFLLNELCPPYEDGIKSLCSVFEKEFPIAAGRCEYISACDPAQLDDAIAAAGGLGMVLASIGTNSSLAFNEPSTPFASCSHEQKLTESSRRDIAAFFGADISAVPGRAVTAGIETITKAGSIITAAFGENKAKAVFKMLYARTDSTVPSAFLQLPAEVTVYLDSRSAAEL